MDLLPCWWSDSLALIKILIQFLLCYTSLYFYNLVSHPYSSALALDCASSVWLIVLDFDLWFL